MQPTFIESHIKRGNRNLLLIGLTLAIIGGGMAVLFNRWFPVLILVPGLIALGSWLGRMFNPSGHPIYKRLAEYGDARQLAEQVNQEFGRVKPTDTSHFGANWLAQGDTYGLSLVPWSDIAWLHIYTNMKNGRPSSCYVRVWSRDGKQFVAPAGVRPGEVEQLLVELRTRAPWAEVGYSPELRKLWKDQRAEFIKRVDTRRGRYGPGLASKAASGYSQI